MKPVSMSIAAMPWARAISARPLWSLGAVLLICGLVAAGAGAVVVSARDWLAPLSTDQPLTGSAYVLWHLRVPRVLFAALIGAALGLSGALTQGLFRNPLADPGLLGITSGAACAAALSIVVIAGSGMNIPFSWRYWLLPAAAFVGAIGVCCLLNRLARWLTADSIAGLLLTGIALNALATSVIGLCIYLATDEQLRNLSFWMLGSLAASSWVLVLVLSLLTILAMWRAGTLARTMNALALGEATAAHIGVDVGRLRAHTIVLVALLSGFAVAWCGMIGFIGLVAPHIVRTLIGPDQRRVVPMSMGAGAVLLLAADTVARTAAIPAEIPVGVFTALLGAPFFLVLLAGFRKGI